MLSPAQTAPRLTTLILLTGLSLLSLNMFLPSLVHISEDFGVPYSLVSLSIAGYLAVTAVLQLIFGPLSDRFGRRPVLLVALVIFVIASGGCLLARDYWVFLGFRLLQGAVIAGAALSRAVVRDMMSPKEAAATLGFMGMAMAVAPMLGPMLGGALDTFFGWRASFVVFVAGGAAMLALTWADLGETNLSRSETFGQQMRTYPELFRSRRFWGYALCMAFSVGSFFAFLAGAPLVTSLMFDITPGRLGFYLGSITMGFVFGSFIAGRLARDRALATMMIAGRVVACSGLTIGICLFLSGVEHELALFGTTIFVGIGNGLTMPSANAGVMSVRANLAGSASGLAGALVVGGGALLTWLAGLVVTERTAALGLLGLMLAAAVLSLLCALWVAALERRLLPESAFTAP